MKILCTSRRAVLTALTAFTALTALTVLPGLASAQNFPSKPIKFVVGFPAGSSIDAVSRVVMEDIRARTGAVIVIDNRPGALGAVGMTIVEQADPDGYTMMPSSSATHSSGPHLLKTLNKLEPVANLSHVGRMVTFDIAVVTSSAGAYGTAPALVAAAKAKPGDLTYGYGSGTGQVSGASFARAAGLDVRPVPYKGQPAALQDLLGQRIDFVASDLGAVLGHVGAGTLKAVAMMAEKRSAILPDVPTTAELGLGGAVLTGWIGVDGPAKLAAPARQWWSEQIEKAVASPEVREKLLKVGMETAPLFGEPFAAFVEAEYGRWGQQVKQAGIEAE